MTNTGYRFHRPPLWEDIEAVRAVRVYRVIENHIHGKYEIGVIEDGGAEYRLRGTAIQATSGSVVIVNAGEAHAVTSHEGGCTFSLLYATPERMRRAAMEAGLGDVLPVFDTCALQDPVVAELLLQVHAALESRNEDDARDDVDLLLQRALATLVVRAAACSETTQRQHAAVARVKAYIDEHYAESISIDSLAQIAGLSKFHLIRVFRDVHGMPPHAYKNAVRIALAREALATGRTAADVALETGFADQSHFTRRFKRLVGVAPGEYARWSSNRHQLRRRKP